MTANQEKQTTKTKLYLIPGIVIVCFLIGGLIIRFQRTSHISRTSASPSATIQINVPETQYPTIPPSAPAFTASIHGLGPSAITGMATFKEVAGTVAILLHVDNLPGDEESIVPVELRYGTCAALGALAYPMTAPDAGESETDLSINLKQFSAQKPMAVVLYRSPQDHTVIACGDIP
jgi:hypothetical protein